jgi:HEAT repeat protein
LRGEPLEDGPEEMPDVAAPEITPALEAGDVEGARAALERARQADMAGDAEAQIWAWFEASTDPREAVRTLFSVGSQHTLRAALKVLRGGTVEDIAAVAGIFCARYPTLRKWEELCEDPVAEVREAAAEAAKGNGGKEHLPVLAKLLEDPSEGVRLSAFLAFRDIEPGADKLGYDYRKPEPSAVAALVKLAESR